MTAPAPSSPAPAHAGIHFPPPFIYAGALLAGWVIERAHPWALTHADTRTRSLLAAFCALAFLAMAVSALVSFRRARTTPLPNRPTTLIVTTGPYRWTRNPMYVSLAFLYVSIAVLRNSAWSLVLLPVALLVVDRLVIAREERYLATAFPDEYGTYRKRVRRWL